MPTEWMTRIEPFLTAPWLLALFALGFALMPAWLATANLRRFRPPRRCERGEDLPAVSVLIPARNEEAVIEGAVRSALANRGVELEVVVLDDGSEDATAAIVRRLAEEDSRVRLEGAPALPAGWCGKQHACAVLATRARHPLRVFVDADVVLEPDGLARIAAFQEESGAALVSGFPRQVTDTWAEKLLIPLIHFVLMGYLPMGAMRRSRQPGYGAACGQLVAVDGEAYDEVGGHRAIRSSLHDGLQLPRLFRRHGHATDLFDATDVATCRMYHGARQVFAGLAKNAHEGMGSPGTIVPMTLLLLAGQVLPFVLAGLALAGIITGWPAVLAFVALALAWVPRWVEAVRFRQSWLGALLHPVGVLALLGIQWWALGRHLLGRPATWKGRSYNKTARHV